MKTFDEFIIEGRRIPKLRKENLKAAKALVSWLGSNPGANDSKIKIFINSQKELLKKYKKALYSPNYQNILDYLHGTNQIVFDRIGKEKKYYVKTNFSLTEA